MQTDAFGIVAETVASDIGTVSPLTTLVGEGKKFKTVEDLAKGKLEADNFIEQLKKEKAELHAALQSKATEAKVQETIQETTQTNTKASVGEDNLRTLVAQTVQNLFAEQEVQSNIVTVNKKLQEVYGDNAAKKVADRAAELNVGVDFLKSVAAKSPSAFYKLLDTTQAQAPSGGVAQSTVTTPISLDTKQGKNWEDYQNMRKTDPVTYYSSAVQNEIYQARRQGRLVIPT